MQTVTVFTSDKRIELECEYGSRLTDVLAKNNIYVSNPCGGRGTCGKCLVKVIEGNAEISSSDIELVDDSMLSEGYRLGCKVYVEDNMIIEVVGDGTNNATTIGDKEEYSIVNSWKTGNDTCKSNARSETKLHAGLESGYGIAVDIGTTTIAMCLVALEDGEIIDNYSALNNQRIYGSDVISRIDASNSGKSDELRRIIVEDINEGIRKLISSQVGDNKSSNSNVDSTKENNVKVIVIVGNTTMLHLLRGYSTDGLGKYPFTPVSLEKEEGVSCDILPGCTVTNAKCIILPGISAFVGSDIVSGLYACDFHKKEKVSLFVDLGTNGELAIGNKDRILVASTAAGPVFEGGNISCGTGSVKGAICSTTISKNIFGNKVDYKTVMDGLPVGICGTGVIEIVAEMLKSGIIDDGGLMDEKYDEEGLVIAAIPGRNVVSFTQKDVREVQLAKGAIRAGIELLIKEYGITMDDIDSLYIAGGFGYYLDINKAAIIGMIPKELIGRTHSVGNTALMGAVKYIEETEEDILADKLAIISKEVVLANLDEFNDLYMECMMF